MNQSEMLHKLEQILSDVQLGVLATIDPQGAPHLRWMTVLTLRGRPKVLFAVTAPDFTKLSHLAAHPEVEWMLQTRMVDQVINLRGKINVLDNPAIKSEVIEQFAKCATAFWHVNLARTDFVVLETIITEATYFLPMQGVKDVVSFA
jgi:general stress protein 26